MTHITLTLSNYLQSPIEGFVDLLRTINQKIERQRQIRSTIKELNKLSNRELQDIGISRGDIWAIAHDDTSFKRTSVSENSNLRGWV